MFLIKSIIIKKKEKSWLCLLCLRTPVHLVLNYEVSFLMETHCTKCTRWWIYSCIKHEHNTYMILHSIFFILNNAVFKHRTRTLQAPLTWLTITTWMTHKDAKLAPHLESSALGSAFNHSRKYNYKHSVYNNPIHCLHPYGMLI
jgi:hypothetical protein